MRSTPSPVLEQSFKRTARNEGRRLLETECLTRLPDLDGAGILERHQSSYWMVSIHDHHYLAGLHRLELGTQMCLEVGNGRLLHMVII